jgi:hypothetical protein
MNICEGRWRLENGNEVILSRHNVHPFILSEIYNNDCYKNVSEMEWALFYNEQGQCIQSGTMKREGGEGFLFWDVKELVEAKVEDKVERVINNAILCLAVND